MSGSIDPATDRMVGTVRVGNEPRFATFAFGSVWVSNYGGSSVSRIDPANAKVIATVTTDFGGQIVAPFDGTIWISSTDFNTVQRIDPSTNEVVATIDTERLSRWPARGRRRDVGRDRSGTRS